RAVAVDRETFDGPAPAALRVEEVTVARGCHVNRARDSRRRGRLRQRDGSSAVDGVPAEAAAASVGDDILATYSRNPARRGLPIRGACADQGQAPVAVDGVARQIAEGRIDDHQLSSWIKDKGEGVAAHGRDCGAAGETPIGRNAVDIDRTAA